MNALVFSRRWRARAFSTASWIRHTLERPPSTSKLTYAAVIRSSDSWRGVKVTEFELGELN